MEIKYLENLDGRIFDVICQKTLQGIKCTNLLINPLCRFIDDEADSQFLINTAFKYSEQINSLTISETNSEELMIDANYFIFGIIKTDNNALQFAYSEEFNLSEEDLEIAQNSSIDLGNVIISILQKNEASVVKNLESELTEMIEYNYKPLKDGIIEVFGVVISNYENGNIDLSARYYSSDDKETNTDSNLSKMFDMLFPIISNNIKTYNLFMVNEPVTLIKLGIRSDGEYIIDTNHILLNNLDESTLNKIKTLLSDSYETL